MVSNKQTAVGSNIRQVNGDHNIFVDNLIVPGQRPLTHSLIHELLDIVYLQPLPRSMGYSLQDPVQMHEKLHFNNAEKYISIIDNHSDDYAQVDLVMKDYPNSEEIVKRLRDMFIDVVDEFDENGSPCVGNGNGQLDSIKSNLADTIVTDSHFNADSHTAEQIEQFCIALIAYGISKCKILETPD
ncbi:hypothetical protein [Lancefieldella rimae]|uniref:hypothetical protein n=1 Tax=Lancefieldella rimae TaxID=1383 RepID=UPI0028E247FC|nr:hypothetical protein [Lancefieldella rimae]